MFVYVYVCVSACVRVYGSIFSNCLRLGGTENHTKVKKTSRAMACQNQHHKHKSRITDEDTTFSNLLLLSALASVRLFWDDDRDDSSLQDWMTDSCDFRGPTAPIQRELDSRTAWRSEVCLQPCFAHGKKDQGITEYSLSETLWICVTQAFSGD